MIERYSNPEISRIWTLENKYRIWLWIELEVCEAWYRRGLIPEEDIDQIRKKANFDVKRIAEIEEEVQHDVIAFLTNVKEHVGKAGRWIHYGLTSSDVGDTALSIQLVQSADIILRRIDSVLEILKKRALEFKDLIMIGRTHGIHGEPITLGLKFAHFYAEMLRNKERLIEAKRQIAVGKLSGAVGTFSNLNPDLEEEVCERLGLKPEKIATQVISRDRHAFFISVLGIIAGTLERMAQEIRLLQKTEGREIEEPFAEGQKGSSAMPHKRNPVISERICGLARVIQSNVMTALRNMPLWHERDISHSSAERVILPDSTIALDYILDKMCYILNNLHVYPENIQRVLNATRGLIFSQKVLLALVQKGLEREESYKIVQGLAMEVWNDPNLHFKEEILRRDIFRKYLTEKEVEEIFDLKAFLKNVDAIYKRLELL
ncbi:MAG: adenylosuccinate lyase [Leptospiraceae bacterium]|jgi:adenylosuccinate lyase|nr:adenylosuccinate lyase [Leptospiraceae bacterium]